MGKNVSEIKEYKFPFDKINLSIVLWDTSHVKNLYLDSNLEMELI